MNEAKPLKWYHWVKALALAIISAWIVNLIEGYVNMNLIKSLFQTLFIKIWPMWFGIGVGLIYLAIREIIAIHQFLTSGMKFNEQVSALNQEKRDFMDNFTEQINDIDQEKRDFMTKTNDSYNGISAKIDKIAILMDKIENKTKTNR